MDEGTGILPGLPPVVGKPVHLAFDGGLMTVNAGEKMHRLAGVKLHHRWWGTAAALVQTGPR
jgi:hypothetical protein